MHTCPICERKLRNPKNWHNCVKVNIDELFVGKAENIVLAFDKLLSEIVDWEEVDVSATKNCIVFVHHQTFLIIRPLKKELDLKFYSAHRIEIESILKSLPHSGKFENHLRVSNVEDITRNAIMWIKQSYELLK
jgi:Domain of unknown function (DUF5655)